MPLHYAIIWTLHPDDGPPREVDLGSPVERPLETLGDILRVLPERGSRLVAEGRLWEVREKALRKLVSEGPEAQADVRVEISLHPAETW